MGTIPELNGIIFPSSSGWMPEGSPASSGLALPQVRAGRRPGIIDLIPKLVPIIFPSSLGWVLMTVGYPPL